MTAELLQPAMELHRQRRFAEAEQAYINALHKEPASGDAWCNLANVQAELRKFTAAETSARHAIAFNPKNPGAHNTLGTVLLRRARPYDAYPAYLAAHNLDPLNAKCAKDLLTCALYRDDLSVDDINALHKRVTLRFNVTRPVSIAPRNSHPRIRVGFLSSDLREHVVANILLPLVIRLDRDQFELVFFAHDTAYDSTTDKYKSLGAWHAVSNLTDDQAAQLIRSCKIDILVSCAGHLDYNRATICAHRAAPIQISMFDVATSGLEQMDYFAGDGFGEREWFSEKSWRVQPAYVVESLADFPAIRSDEREAGGVRFVCFNNPIKISPSCLRAWGRILARVPESTLMLAYMRDYETAELRDRFAAEFVKGGAQAGQLWFDTDEAPRMKFLERYNRYDIALDTFPFSGSTTTFQALAMGLPVLTLAGDRVSARWSAAMLETLGWDAFVTGTVDEYVDRAVWLSSRVPSVVNERAYQRELIAHSPLCDPGAYAKQVAEFFMQVARNG